MTTAQARQTQSGGDDALRRMEEQIEAAREIPEAPPYIRPTGDPLERLQARMRGELEEEDEGAAEAMEATPSDRERGLSGDETGQHRLGQALEASLRRRPLPGDVRAEIALRLAAMMEGPGGVELEPIWDLVVFGGSADGSGNLGSDGDGE